MMIHVRRILLRRKAGIAVMIVCFCLAVGTVKPQFLTLGSLRIVLLLVSLIIGVFAGSQLVIVARHVDLSIGSIWAAMRWISGWVWFAAVRRHATSLWTLGRLPASWRSFGPKA